MRILKKFSEKIISFMSIFIKFNFKAEVAHL